MRRVLAVLVALFGLSPALYAQYPYSPAPYGPIPGYGYPPATMQPGYGPNPMMVRPAPYYPPPMMQRGIAPMSYQQAPRVYNFGPLPDENAVPLTNAMNTLPTTPPVPANYMPIPTTYATNAPAATPVSRSLPSFFKSHHGAPVQEACGPQGCPPAVCGDSCGSSCGPTCGPTCNPVCDACPIPPQLPRPHPAGHLIATAGVYMIVPFPSTRAAFNTTNAAGASSTTDFTHELEYAPRFSLGYVFHNGWGARAEYWFLDASTGANASNANVANRVTTPLSAPFQIVSPSATLLAGIGTDQLSATQTIEMQIGNIEVVKECSLFDFSFLCGIGARYGRISQGYSATRTNAGGVNGATVVGFDRESLQTQSRFEGVGPTFSLDGVCPLYHNCVSLYSNVRGSALFGVERFTQDRTLQSNTTVAGVPNFVNTSNSSRVTDTRTAYSLELEAGLQFGHRIGPCYVFSRAGASAQRWWDVGNPVGSTGSLNFLGGTVLFGLTY